MFALYEGSLRTGFENETVEGLIDDISKGKRDGYYPFNGMGVGVRVFNSEEWEADVADSEVDMSEFGAPASISVSQRVLEFMFADSFSYFVISEFDADAINAAFWKELPDRGFRIEGV